MKIMVLPKDDRAAGPPLGLLLLRFRRVTAAAVAATNIRISL